MQLQDRIWQWGSLTAEFQNDLFKIDQIGIRPYEFPNSVHMSVTYEFDLNLEVIDRQVYSILDWLGDIGGLGEASFFLGTIFLGIFHYGKFEVMLIRELFRAGSQKDDNEEELIKNFSVRQLWLMKL